MSVRGCVGPLQDVMATEYITNIVVDNHNTWTLIKHVAGSVNKVAAKTDEKVYGTQVHVQVREKTFSEKHPTLSGIGTVVGSILMGCLILAVFIGLLTGNIRGRDCIGF